MSGWPRSRRAWRARRERPPGRCLRLGCRCVMSLLANRALGMRSTISYSHPRDMNSRLPNQITVPRRSGRMGLPSGSCWDDKADTQYVPLPGAPTVGVLDRGVLNQLVNLNCVPLTPDDDAKRHKVYTSSGNRCPTSNLRDRSCIPYTEVLVVGGYKLGERGSRSQVSAKGSAGYRVLMLALEDVCELMPVLRSCDLVPRSGPGRSLL